MHRLKKPLFLIWLFHKKLFKYLFFTLLTFVIVTLILSGIFTGVLYYGNKHGHLQDWINKGLNPIHLSYQTAKVSWSWGDPSLKLTGIEIMAPQTMSAPLKFDSISVDLGIWDSILHRQVITNDVTISGLNFDIAQGQNGGFEIAGFKQAEAKTSTSFKPDPELLNWFLAQREIYLENIHLRLQLRNDQILNLSLSEVGWTHHFDYDFKVKGSVAEIPASDLELEAELKPGDDPLDLNAWSADFEGYFIGKDFTPLLGKANIHNLAWLSGGGGINFEGSFAHQSLKNLALYVSLQNVNLSHVSNETSLLTSRFDEAISWNAKGNGAWQLSIKPMRDDNLIPSTVDINHNPAGVKVWEMKAQDINLSMVGQWIDFWFPPKTYTAKVWEYLNLSGIVSKLNFTVGPQGGSATLESQNLVLGKNPIFPNGWPASNVQTQMSWKLPKDNKTLADVTVTTLKLSNPWLNLHARGTIQVPVQKPEQALLNLQGSFSGKDLDAVKANYIPQDFVSKGLSEWLMQGLVKIPEASGTFIWQGKLDQIPYDKAPGLFQIKIHVIGGAIEPWESWPQITNITANLLFKNQLFTIDSNQAMTAGVPLHNVHFALDFSPPEKEIVITGQATPTAEQGLNYLAAMPITGKSIDKGLESIEVTGKLPIDLKLTIPLEENQPIVATGDVTFTKNDWSLSKGGTPLLNDITGQLHFVNDKISVEKANFNALNQNLTISIPESPLDHLRIMIQKFMLLSQTFDNLEMDVTPSDSGTVLTFTHPLVQGTLTLSNNDNPIMGRFSHLTLPIIAGDNSDKAAQDNLGKLADNPEKEEPILLGLVLGKLPALNITIDELDYGKNDLGEFFLESAPILNGIEIKHINLTSKNVAFDVTGQVQTVEDQDHFSAKGVLSSEDYGDLLTALNYPNMVSEGSGKIHFNLNWIAQLLNVNYSTLNGTVEFGLADGKLLQINAGFARIFGLVSLDTIFSTLSLNFQKVLSSGLTFDSISGGYTIKNGVATANKDGLRVTGPSLNMILRGQMDLANQTLNQTATVMPQVGNSIAIAAAVVGGPIAGIATWFADKLLGSTVFRNAGIDLKITGTFDKPVVSLFKPANS